MGTPGFWSPEMACGAIEKIGPSSDVFGLGATLYALLTGNAPFQGPSLAAQVVDMESGPVPIGVDARINEVCQRCLAYEPEDRYASATHLAADLERWLRDERPLAGAAKKASLVTPRAAAVAVAVAVAACFGTWFATRQRPPRIPVGPVPEGAPVAPVDTTRAADDVPTAAPASSGSDWRLTTFEGTPAPATLEKAWLELAEKQPARALARLDAHLEAHPDDAEALLWRAVARLRLQDYEAAQRDALRVAAQRPADSRPHIVLKYAAVRLIDLQGAAREQVESDRKVAGAYGPRGELLHMLGDVRLALNDYAQGLEASPEDVRLIARYASTSYQVGPEARPRTLRLLAELDRLLQESGRPLPSEPLPPFWSDDLVQDYFSGQRTLLDELRASGRHEDSLRIADRWLANRPTEQDALHRRTSLLLDMQRYPEALSAAQRWQRASPSGSRPHYSAGKALRKLGRLQEALASFSQAHEMGYGARALKERGEVRLALKRYELAYQDFDSFLDSEPDHFGARACRAIAAAHSGRLEEARAALASFEGDARNRDLKGYWGYVSRLRTALSEAESAVDGD
jgi:tetratricopeptide (TPR) repeat protein